MRCVKDNLTVYDSLEDSYRITSLQTGLSWAAEPIGTATAICESTTELFQ